MTGLREAPQRLLNGIQNVQNVYHVPQVGAASTIRNKWIKYLTNCVARLDIADREKQTMDENVCVTRDVICLGKNTYLKAHL